MSTTDAPFPLAKPDNTHNLKEDSLSSTSIASSTVKPSDTPSQNLAASGVKSQTVAKQPLKVAAKSVAKKSMPAKPMSQATQNKVVSMSNSVAKELFSATQDTAKTAVTKTQNIVSKAANTAQATAKMMSENAAPAALSGLENARTIVKQSAGTMSRLWEESLVMRQNHMEACTEAGALASEVAGQLAENARHFAHEAIAESVDISKNIFACRTATDVLALQNRLAQNNFHRMINESARSSNLMFNFFSKVVEPFSETMADANKRMINALKTD